MGERLADDARVNPFGFVYVFKGAFPRESVRLKPVKQCRAAEYPGVWILRCVNVGVCEGISNPVWRAKLKPD